MAWLCNENYNSDIIKETNFVYKSLAIAFINSYIIVTFIPHSTVLVNTPVLAKANAIQDTTKSEILDIDSTFRILIFIRYNDKFYRISPNKT